MNTIQVCAYSTFNTEIQAMGLSYKLLLNH